MLFRKAALFVLLCVAVAARLSAAGTPRARRPRVVLVLVAPLIALFSHRPLALLLGRAGIAAPLPFGIWIWHCVLLCAGRSLTSSHRVAIPDPRNKAAAAS